jgi:hypothetical protein
MGRQLCRASGFALYAFATVSQASIATRVPEDFGVISGRKEFGVYLDGVAQEVTSSSTKFRWAAYSSDCVFAIRNDSTTASRTVVEGCAGIPNVGGYVYTVFDTDSDGVADKLLDHLQSVTVTVGPVDTDVKDGALRILVRAADGKWYLSDTSLPIISLSTQVLKVNAASGWTEVTAPGTTLDDVADDNTGPLTLGASGLHPDLSIISGGGFYFSDFTNETVANARIDDISFNGVTWEMDSFNTVVQPVDAGLDVWSQRPRLRLFDTPLPKDDTLATWKTNGALGSAIDGLTARGVLPIVMMTDTSPATTVGQLAMAAELQARGLDIEAFITALPLRECDLWPNEQYWIAPSTTTTPVVPASGIGASTFGLCPRGDKWPAFPKFNVIAGSTKIRDKLFGLSDAGFTLSALWTDDERQPFPWNGSMAAQQVAAQLGYYANVAVNLSDFESFKAYTMTLRRDLQAAAYLAPMSDLFYGAVWGNYDAYASNLTTPFIDKNGVSYPARERLADMVTMPSSYANTRILRTYFPTRTAISQAEADSTYLFVMLRTFSSNAANVTPVSYTGALHSNLHIVPYVSRYVADVTDEPWGSRGMSKAMYREFLRHVWLRGADSLFIFDAGITNKNDRFEPPLYGQTPFQAFDQVEDARAVYDELLDQWSYLNEGAPMNFATPSMTTAGILDPGVMWSGLKKPDGSCLIRAVAVGTTDAKTVTISGCGGDVVVEAPVDGRYYIIENGVASEVALR